MLGACLGPRVGKFSLSPVHPALLPQADPPPTHPAKVTGSVPRPDHGARQEAGPAPCPHLGSALHTCAPASGWPPGSQRLRAGSSCERRAGPAYGTSEGPSWKGHSLLGASHHQHSGVTRNEPNPQRGGRATAQLCPAHRLLTPPPAASRCPTEPRDKGAPARHLGRGTQRRTQGRLRGGRNTAALPPAQGHGHPNSWAADTTC